MAVVAPGFTRYLDPGTGSMLLQYLAALFLAALLVVKSYFKQIEKTGKKLVGKILSRE